MIPKSPDVKKIVAGFLVFATLTASVPAIALAQSYQGNSITSLVTDSVGAVTNALISCNQTAIKTGIKSLFTSGASTVTSAATGAATKAADTAAGGTGAGTQQVELSAADRERLDAIRKNTDKTADNSDTATKKITCTRAIEKAVAGTILRQLTISTVNWINHGLNGNPFFATDAGSSFKSLRDQTIKELSTRLGFDRKNYPFGQAVVQGLVSQLSNTFEQQARYSLNAVIAQQYPGSSRNDFMRDFAIGGWDAFLSQMLWNNNPFGFTINTQNELGSRLDGTYYSPVQDLKDQLLRSGGFFDQKVCVDPNYSPTTADKGAQSAAMAADKAAAAADQAASIAEQANARAADYYAAHPNDPAAKAALDQADAASAAANRALGEANDKLTEANTKLTESTSKTKCRKWQVQTPGSIIAHTLTKNLDNSNDQLISNEDLNADITAIFDALSNQLLQKGLKSLSSNGNYGNDFANNSNGTAYNNGGVEIFSGPDIGFSGSGEWMTAGANFNLFTDIPDVIRYEDNNGERPTVRASGCTADSGFSPNGTQFCTGKESLPTGYQQLIQAQIDAQSIMIRSIYALDYCIPGPYPGAIRSIDQNAQAFVSNPKLFPASADSTDWNKALSNYGVSTFVLAGAIVGSVVPGLGTALGASIGAVVGAAVTLIGNDKDHHDERVYGNFMNGLMGVDFNFGTAATGREHLNGHDNTANIVTKLANRYAEAMHMVYESTSEDVDDALDAKDAEPAGTQPGKSGTAEISSTNAFWAKTAASSWNAFESISDLVSINESSYGRLDDYGQSIADSKSRLANSKSVERQLIRLVDRINHLPELDGYPGLVGDLSIVPVITLKGQKTVTVAMNSNYTDAGATASDRDEDMTSRIVTVNKVDTSIPGTYTITYDLKTRSGISANQVTRTVRVLDEVGNPSNEVIVNYAAESADFSAEGYTGSATYATEAQAVAEARATVRDYNKDYQIVRNIKNPAQLSEYEAELKRIGNTFSQIAPYIHGPDDLKQEAASLDTLVSGAGDLATYDANGTLKAGALYECIKRTSDQSNPGYVNDGGGLPKDYPVTKDTPPYIKYGGPTGRVAFTYVVSSGKIETLPKWLTAKLPPQQSFLPNWHFAQGDGVNILGKNWFPNNGQTEYPPAQKDHSFLTRAYIGETMTYGSGYTPANPAEAKIDMGSGVVLDLNKLIKNHDVSTINMQPIINAFTGLESAILNMR